MPSQSEETVQQRNMRMGWGCRCHGQTFCPDLVCIGYEDDVPMYVRKDSELGRRAPSEGTDHA